VAEPSTVVNTASVNDGAQSRELSAITIVNSIKIYLPIIIKGW
jgi:hypothetical protein